MKLITLMTTGLTLCVAAPVDAQSFSNLLKNLNNGLAKAAKLGSTPINNLSTRNGPPKFGTVEQTSIAGVQLNMTPQEVRDGIKSQGYSIENEHKGASFDQLARKSAVSRNPAIIYNSMAADTSVSKIIARGPSGEFMSVHFLPMPEGPRVDNISLSSDVARVSRISFEKSVYEKYGPTSRSYPGSLEFFWCNAGTDLCGQDWVGAKYSYLMYSSGPADPVITLSNGPLVQRFEQLQKAEINRIAPMQQAHF